jgi:hypothetical protein
VGGIATPTIVQESSITTWKQGTALHFKFSIPDITPTKQGGAALSCGDQVIIQIGPASTAQTALAQGQEFRYELAISGNAVVGGPQLRIPRPVGDPQVGKWKASPEGTTGALISTTAVGNPYSFELTIPLSEIGNPAGDFGLAFAIINDLGHSHGATNEASGTAFPVGMGLTPASDPGLTCGGIGSANGETATGNWINPSTWGVGFVALSTTPNVTLNQGPEVWLSRAIRIGRCSVTDFNSITEVTAANWATVQQSVSDNWYKFNALKPCKMTIWINATVSPPGTVQKRFLAVWGRPGIAPQAWFFAGVTNAVSVSSPTTAVSFVWDKPTPVPGGFSDHPCLRVYVLPATFTAAQQTALNDLMNDTSVNGDKLQPFENAFNVSFSLNTAAQMNFANYDNASSCSEATCMPAAAIIGSEDSLLARWSPFATLHAQVAQRPGDDRPRPGDGRSTSIRLIAHGFGVADPQGTKPYTYVEDIGGLGWAVSNQLLAQAESIPLRVQVSNPAITEKTFANGTAVEVPSPNRRILVVPVVSVVPGTPMPRIDLSALNRFAETPLTPGQTFDSQISIVAVGLGWNAWLMKWWWLILLVLLLIAIGLYLARRPATP